MLACGTCPAGLAALVVVVTVLAGVVAGCAATAFHVWRKRREKDGGE